MYTLWTLSGFWFTYLCRTTREETYGPSLLRQFLAVDNAAETGNELWQVLRRDVAVRQRSFKYS